MRKNIKLGLLSQNAFLYSWSSFRNSYNFVSVNHYPWQFNILRRKLMSWAPRDTTLQKKKKKETKQHFYLHSRTNNNRLVVHIQRALWRKLEPLFSRNKMLYASKTEVTENALALEGKSFRPDTKTTVNRYVCHDLSVWNKRLKSQLLSENVQPSRS